MHLLHPFANRLLETEIRSFADIAFASGTPVLIKMGKSPSDTLSRIAFVRAAHAGFIRGQKSIIDRILSPNHKVQLGWQDELTLRKGAEDFLPRSNAALHDRTHWKAGLPLLSWKADSVGSS